MNKLWQRENTPEQEFKPRQQDIIDDAKCFFKMKKRNYKENFINRTKRIANIFNKNTELHTFFHNTFPELPQTADPEKYTIALAIELLYPWSLWKVQKEFNEAGYPTSNNPMSNDHRQFRGYNDGHKRRLIKEMLNKKIKESFITEQFKEIVFWRNCIDLSPKKDIYSNLLLESNNPSYIAPKLLSYKFVKPDTPEYKLTSSMISLFSYKNLRKDKFLEMWYKKEEYEKIRENYFTIWFNHYKDKYGEDVAAKYLYFAYLAGYQLPQERINKARKNTNIPLSIKEEELKEIAKEYRLNEEEQEKIIEGFKKRKQNILSRKK